MMIHDITAKVGKHKARKRVGRGRGSGHGKTSGRGHKGYGSGAGNSRKIGFEGGQMPWFRRIPKRGFSNFLFRTEFQIVNLNDLARKFSDGDTVDEGALLKAGLIRDEKKPIKILGEGESIGKLTITAHKFSASAKQKIEDAGGSITEIPVRNKWVREKKAK